MIVPYGICLCSVPTQKKPWSASFIAVESVFRTPLVARVPRPAAAGTFFSIHSMIGCSTCRLFFSIIIMWPLP